MSRRLEIELTSRRPDGTWTWRAAGAKQPKGELDGGLLPQDAAVGSVLRADAEFLIDGIEITAVLAPKGARKGPELLEVTGSRRDEPLVTTQLVSRGRGDRPGRGRGRDRDGERGQRRERRDGERPRGDRPRGPRPEVPERPKPKRLRPGRAFRNAVIDEIPVEQRPIADQVLRGGIAGVREAVAKQNESAKQQNQPEVPTEQVVAMAEALYPKLRDAEWKDRAAASIADLDELDLRDLRSVVVAGEGATHDDEAREMLEQLRSGLTRRVAEEHDNWVGDISVNLDAGRFVRALRLSSRPPKAGTPVPPDLASRLVAAVSEGLTSTTNQELWAAALDALAFSPVRQQVTPTGRPETPTDDLLAAVRRVADRLPKIAELFGVDPSEAAAARRRRPARGTSATKARGPKTPGPESPAEEPAATDSDPAPSPSVTAVPGPTGSGSVAPEPCEPASAAPGPSASESVPEPASEEPGAPAALTGDADPADSAQGETPETAQPETTQPETAQPETAPDQP